MSIHWGEIRVTLSEAQNHRCGYCGVHMVLVTPEGAPGRPWDIATVDHIEPRSFGGTDDWSNLAMACRACNEARMSMGAMGFYRLVRRWLKSGERVPSADFAGFRLFIHGYMEAKLERRKAERAIERGTDVGVRL